MNQDLPQPPRLLTELAMVVFTLASLAGFQRVFREGTWVLPVFGTALVVYAVCAVTRRLVPAPLLAAPIDLLAVLLTTVWTVVGSTTVAGLPLGQTWREVGHALTGLGNQFAVATVPAQPTTGFLLLAAGGAGVVALLGPWLLFRVGRALCATIPGFAAFVTCCVLGAPQGRAWSVSLEVGAGALLLLCDRAVMARSESAWFGSTSGGGAALTVKGGLAAVAGAVVVGAVIAPTVSSPDGHGPLGWQSLEAGTTRIVKSPLVSLQTRLLHESNTVVLTVHSTAPSYWRITSLDSFDGVNWNANDTYRRFSVRLPGIGPTPKGAKQVTENFDIGHLDSVWLPLAFDPEEVRGAGPVSYDPRSGSLLTPHATADGLHYTVTSLEYLATLSPKALSAAPALPAHSSTLAPYLQLPPTVPANVVALAKQIVKGKRTEYAKALALQDFFYGPEFTYSLHPPSNGSGTGALEAFLFKTKTGYCQQFAGAYAVMARALGLPTRLAVGFTTGKQIGPDTYQVTDADAHTWPEVWFPSYGWVPFEPTKGASGEGFAIPGATGYTGNTAALATSGTPAVTPKPTPSSTSTTAPPSTTHGSTGKGPKPATPNLGVAHGLLGGSGLGGTGGGATTARRHGDGWTVVLIVVAALIALAPALAAANWLARRVRWWRRRHRRPLAGASGRYRLAATWDELAELAAWRGLRRRPAETPAEFAARVATRLQVTRELDVSAELQRLSDLITRSTYGEVEPSAAELAEADACRRRFARRLGREEARRERLRILLDPRLAWVAAAE